MFPFLGTLEGIFINSCLGLFSLPRLQLHEQIVLHSNTPASRYSTVSFGSHSQINTTWTRRHKQLISAFSSSSYAVWRIVLVASSIFKDFHISQKVALSPRVKHTKKSDSLMRSTFSCSTAANGGFFFACKFKTNVV